MDEETLRKMAIEEFLKGKSPTSVYRDLGRSRPWFYKWLHRYQSREDEWFKDKSKAPHDHPNKTPAETHKLVMNIRLQLEENPFAQVGVSAIKWEFRKLGVNPPPDRTINRILKREGLVKKNFLIPPKGWNIPTCANPWGSTASIKPICWAPGTSRTMDVSIPSILWTFTAIASLSILSGAKTTRRWPLACCAAGKRWAYPIFSRSTTNSLSGEAIATRAPSALSFGSAYPWGSKWFSFPSVNPGAMEPLKASMIPTTADFSAPNGSGATVTSDPNRKTSSSFTIRTTGIVASGGKRPCRLSKKMLSGRSSHLPGTNYSRSVLKFRRESFPSSVSSAVTGSWISLESIFPFLRPLSTLMSGLKSLPTCIRFSSTTEMNGLRLFLTNYRHGWTQTLKTLHSSPDRGGQQLVAWDLLSGQGKSTNGVSCIKGINGPGSYPQPLRSPAPEGRRSGVMDNFRTG